MNVGLSLKPKFLSKIFHASHHVGLAAQKQKGEGLLSHVCEDEWGSGPVLPSTGLLITSFVDKTE